MTNHIHLLATPELDDNISKVFQSVGRRYVQYFNFTYQRSGTLWDGRYRATVVDSEQYLLILMRYIELNPVRAGMVAHPRDYAWSSYHHNAQGEEGIAKKLIVRVSGKDRLPIIAALDDVLRLAADNVAGKTGHGSLLS